MNKYSIISKSLPEIIFVKSIQGADSDICQTVAVSSEDEMVYSKTYNNKDDLHINNEHQKCYEAIKNIGYEYTGFSNIYRLKRGLCG